MYNLSDLYIKTAPFTKEIAKINRKYIFGKLELRSPKDNAKLIDYLNKIKLIEDEWNKNNPIPPCEECGQNRYSSLAGICLNFGKCKKAPSGLGA